MTAPLLGRIQRLDSVVMTTFSAFGDLTCRSWQRRCCRRVVVAGQGMKRCHRHRLVLLVVVMLELLLELLLMLLLLLPAL